MRNNSSKETSDHQPPARTSAGFMFKEYGPCCKLFWSCWTHITQDDLKLQWPRWGPFDIPKFVYLYARGYESKQNEWKSYFNWHLEASERNTEKVAALSC